MSDHIVGAPVAGGLASAATFVGRCGLADSDDRARTAESDVDFRRRRLVDLPGALGALAAVPAELPRSSARSRVGFWGALAMAVTAGVGWLFGAVA